MQGIPAWKGNGCLPLFTCRVDCARGIMCNCITRGVSTSLADIMYINGQLYVRGVVLPRNLAQLGLVHTSRQRNGIDTRFKKEIIRK